MTQTHPASPLAQIPDRLHEEATDLVRDLAGMAGDHHVITNEIRAALAKGNDRDGLALLAAALIVIFSECITRPTEPGAFTEASLPTSQPGSTR